MNKKLIIFSTRPTAAASTSPRWLAMTVININATWMQPSCTATGTPILRMLPSTSGWGRRSLRLTWMFVRRLLSHTSARATLAVWAVTVPSAAPTGPSPMCPINRKSSAMLMMHATPITYMGERESPSPRKMAERMLYAAINGMPTKQMRR